MASDPCLQELAQELRAPTFVVIVAEPGDSRGHVQGRVGPITVTHGGVRRGAGEPFEGDEVTAAAAIQAQAMRVAGEPRPCQLFVDAPSGFDLALEVAGNRATSLVFVMPGVHALTLSAAGRTPWSGEVLCQGGESWRMRVE